MGCLSWVRLSLDMNVFVVFRIPVICLDLIQRHRVREAPGIIGAPVSNSFFK